MPNVLLAGGGTAGHANPLVATALELRSRGHKVAALGTAAGLEAELVAAQEIDFYVVPKVPLPRSLSIDLLKVPVRLARAIGAASKAIKSSSADTVVGFGGYVSTPAYVAAWLARVPVVVHEGNARPGLANRLGATIARKVAVTFPGTPLRGAVVTGLPLRSQITELVSTLQGPKTAVATRTQAKETFGWAPTDRVLLVTGGSTGAASLNAATAGAIAALTARGIHVIHLTGRGKDHGALEAQAQLEPHLRARYVVKDFDPDMDVNFAAADAVLCRAGAATVCEITALGIPAIYVPLPHGNGEQALNARSAIEAGAALLLDDADLSPTTLEEAAVTLLLDEAAAAKAREAARSIGVTDGAARLADLVQEVTR